MVLAGTWTVTIFSVFDMHDPQKPRQVRIQCQHTMAAIQRMRRANGRKRISTKNMKREWVAC